MCHFNALPVHTELSRPTLGRVRSVFNTSMFVGAAIYLVVGILGYVHAGEYTCGNILLNFDPKDPLMCAARGVLSVSLLCTYPLILLPCRTCFSRLVSMCATSPSVESIASPKHTSNRGAIPKLPEEGLESLLTDDDDVLTKPGM